jgi:hypothetical protein
MAFTFAMHYHPDYQKRYGKCACCNQGIESGDKIMIGTGYFKHHLIRNHSHYTCWLKEVESRAEFWFFEHEYKRKAMDTDKKAELNRLRAKRYYIQKKGGEPNDVVAKVSEVERQIAFAKSR